jgi:hypothetical protein
MDKKKTASDRHANEQSHCEVSNTLKGGYCENLGTQRTMNVLLCEKHAKQFELEERVACWEAILLHVELWSREARRRGREDVVRLLKLERAEAAAALERAHEDLNQVENEGYYQPKRETYWFVS